MLVIATLAFGPFACQGNVSASDDAPLGGDCETSDDCGSGVCWDFTDHDPACAGKVCSARCRTDLECIDFATHAGAAQPARAQCGSDKLCDFVGSGLGSFVCA